LKPLTLAQQDQLSGVSHNYNGYYPVSYSPNIPPPANFLGLELPLPKKEGRIHFLTKSHIDLSFPDIKTNN
jgi:hypothetical protein